MALDDMRDVIRQQPDQITHSLEVNADVRVEGTFDSMVLAGMGGSGHPGDLLNALGISRRPLYVHRNYDLPLSYLTRMGLTQPLVVTSSYSGNTEESLTAYKLARAESLPLLASASGGTLESWATRDEVPFCRIDFPGMQPRHTLFAAFTGIYAALQNSGLVDDITDDLVRVAEVLRTKTAALEAPAQEIAAQITGKIPVYYSSDTLGFATKNFKIQTNENAKYPAFWYTFPELNHNELLGFSKLKETQNPNQFFVLLLKDPADHPRNLVRMQITKELYEQWGVSVAEFTAEGETLLEKLFYTVTFGLWVTYFVALANKVDPVVVEGVESFKVRLKEVAGDLW